MKTIQPFKNVANRPLEYGSNTVYGQDYLKNLASLEIGKGTRGFRADQSGLWLGAKTFADAPFSVDMEGNVTALSFTASTDVLTKTGTAQSFTGDIQVGNGNVKIDGANKRILINDGTNDRILIGFQSGGF